MLLNKINLKDINNLIKIWTYLPNSLRIKTYKILFFTTIASLLEAVGVGLVIPAVSLIANVNIGALNDSPFYNKIISQFNQNQIALSAASLLFFLYFIKGLFLALMYLMQAKYLYEVKAYISNKLFQKYIYLSYENVIQKNSSEFINNLTTEIQVFANRVMKPMLTLLTEIGVIFAISTLFFLIEPIGTLILLISTIIVVYAFDKASRKYLLRWGRERQENEALKVKIAQEGMLGLREIKITGSEQNFLKVYEQHNKKVTDAEAKEEALYHIPRISLEIIGVWGVLIIVLLTTIEGNANSNIILTIAFFAASAFRMLPSINRIVGSLQSISYCSKVIETILNEISKKDFFSQVDVRQKVFAKKLELIDVDYKYPNSDNFIFKSVNMTIHHGECIGIVGSSGVGKSTFADLISGLVEPTNGDILIDGIKESNNNFYLQNFAGYVQQRIFLLDDSIKKNIALGVDDEKIDLNKIHEVIKSANLLEFLNKLPNGIETKMGELGDKVSGGQRQRIGIARALYSNPQILIFDEGTSALDEISEAEIINTLIKIKGQMTIIIIAHRPSTLRICNSIYKVDSQNIKLVS